ncbi:MAG: citramalate synthase [Solirubrobacterales bacterium]
MSLSAQEKVRVVRKLDELGIHFIEAGFPGSNPKELELFEMLAEVELQQAAVCAFGMTRRRDTQAAEDAALRLLATGFAPVVTLVGKTWGLHLEKVTKVSREENLAMIRDSVAYLTTAGKRVIYDAEHFFDGYRDDPGYALECLRAAAEAGAENVTLCDTNGSSLPAQIAAATEAMIEALDVRGGGDDARARDSATRDLPEQPPISVGIHTHNDLECAVANSLAAVEQGASLVQGTMNGIGERTGNANLTSILPALQLKMGHRCVQAERLARLTDIAHFIDELLNITPDPDQPFVGRNAFAHKGGMHVAGVSADARTFEHVDPAEVGNERELVVSELSGKGTVLQRAERSGIPLDEARAARALRTLKEREHRGYHYEAADASFELLLRKETEGYEPLFRLEGFRVLVEKREDGKVVTEATIKIWVDGERYLRTAEGNGPVNALDKALRGAIIDRHPHLADIELTNYKVRILDEHHGTGAVTRVLLDSSDGEREWGSIGVSENIIEASWEALVDSLEYAFQPPRESSSSSERTDPARTT